MKARWPFIIALALVGILALCSKRLPAAEHPGYMPWDTVGISTNADLSVAVPVPYSGGATNYRIWRDGEVRWGWVEKERSGDYRQWDSRDGWSFGRMEVER